MSIKTLTAKILKLMPDIGKCQFKFLVDFFCLIVACRGRVNFCNLARQGAYGEGAYRRHFGKDFDFLGFGRRLVENFCGGELVLAFDPCFLRKSGGHTDGLGYFWSGCAGRVQRGLEIVGIGALDILNNTCMHLVAKQTLDLKSRASMLDYYASTLRAFAPRLLKISKHLAVDACFSRFPFVSSAIEMGFEVISRLRGDAHLRYAYLGPRRRGRGRPRQFAGKVDVRRPDPQHFQPIVGEVDWIAYQGRVHSKSLKRWVKVVLVHHFGKNGDLKRVGIYFSTDLSMSGADILIYYKSRFQHRIFISGRKAIHRFGALPKPQ